MERNHSAEVSQSLHAFTQKVMICRCRADHESAIADSDDQIVQKLEILLKYLLANHKPLNAVLATPTDVKRWWSQGSEGAPN